MGVPGKRPLGGDAEPQTSARGVAHFLGVAGANAYLVWKDEGRLTLDAVLSGGGGSFCWRQGRRRRSPEHLRRVQSRPRLLQAASPGGQIRPRPGRGPPRRQTRQHSRARAGGFGGGKSVVKLIDFGGATDLRVGTNYSSDETVFDPVYGPREKARGERCGFAVRRESGLGAGEARSLRRFLVRDGHLAGGVPEPSPRETRRRASRLGHLRLRRRGVARVSAASEGRRTSPSSTKTEGRVGISCAGCWRRRRRERPSPRPSDTPALRGA